MIVSEIDVKPLFKAREKFEAFRQHLKTEQDKAGAIYDEEEIQRVIACFDSFSKALSQFLTPLCEKHDSTLA